jgi:hypothetical protein
VTFLGTGPDLTGQHSGNALIGNQFPRLIVQFRKPHPHGLARRYIRPEGWLAMRHTAEQRTGPLRNGNPRGDLREVAKCGAMTRRQTRCQSPAMKNGRCRLHGGLSTGPRTPEGIERIRQAVTKHGFYSAAAKARRRAARRAVTFMNPPWARQLFGRAR